MRRALAICSALSLATLAGEASASGPFEFPDNGPAPFARSGAWLAVGTDPIAAHYNPAALATMRSGASLSLHLPFNKVCYDRRNTGDARTGPRQGRNDDAGNIQYRPACNTGADRPGFVPSLGVAIRVLDQLGLGFAVVPPSAYGTSENNWPAIRDGYNALDNSSPPVPAPYRYMWLGSASTVLFPTLSAGFEIIDGLRVGGGFIWGVAIIDVVTTGVATTDVGDQGDHAQDDTRTHLTTEDFFVPGFVASVHASPLSMLDVAVWYRWIDAVRNSEPDVVLNRPFYDPTLSRVNDECATTDVSECSGKAIRNPYTGNAFETVQFPMELRVGVRFHYPRQDDTSAGAATDGESERKYRDPLHDDVFDIELDGTWTNTSAAERTTVRFQDEDGRAVLPVKPQGLLPPVGDRVIPYDDTFGVRFGGQINAIRDKLGFLVGTWVESQAAADEYLHVEPVVPLRGGFGGGVVFRQDNFDFHFGYQRHWSVGYDNGGDGALRATTGSRTGEDEPFNIDGPLGEDEFRTYHTINGGRVTQGANVFNVGVIARW